MFFYDTPYSNFLLSGTANLDRLSCLVRCHITLRTGSLPTSTVVRLTLFWHRPVIV